MFDCFGFFEPCCHIDHNQSHKDCHHDHHQKDHKDKCHDWHDSCHRRRDHRDDHDHCLDNHVHEYLGSTNFSEFGIERHNHRFAGVTGPAIGSGRSHIHEFFNRTDTTLAHFHNMRQYTGPAVYLENGRHIHFAEGTTTFDDGHLHRFDFATLIEDPTRNR